MNVTSENWPIVFFPEPFLGILIVGALVLTAIGAVALVWMLVRDRRNKQIW